MEEDEIQAHACKFPRVARNDSNKQIFPEGQEIAELRRRGGGSSGGDVPTNRFHSWHHHSSRIIRVSRASGGKDRHSKVMTSKGLRDRRVRLSVTTAIQFYDLQDRLGYDQPSKAVEWLIKAAGDAISELPSLNDTFPPDDNTSKQSGHERRGSVGTEQGMGTGEAETQSQNLSCSNKSAGSSTSDQTSKGSGLSLSRSEIRVKARERARERAAKEREKEKENNNNVNNPISQTASFTELLTGGITSTTATATTCDNEPNLFKGSRQQLWCASATPMDYFNSGHNINNNNNNQSCGLSTGQIQYPQGVCVSPFLNVMGENQTDHQLQHFSFIPDHLIPSDYNLNFTISSNSGLAGFNRGTLQSNSPSFITHPVHRFSSPLDASNNLPFFIGAAAAAAAAPTMEMNHHHHHHHHQFSPGFDGRLQLCYGDASRHSDHKTKPKN